MSALTLSTFCISSWSRVLRVLRSAMRPAAPMSASGPGLHGVLVSELQQRRR